MYILLAVLLVALVWFVVRPRWSPKLPNASEWTGKAAEASKQATARASQASQQATAKAGEMYKGIRGRLKFRQDTRELAKQFKQWVAETAPAKHEELYKTLPSSADGFAIWLSGLAEKDLERFTQRIARFCATLNFDIAWLNDAEVKREPELRTAVEDSVLLYSLAAWRANNVQQDVKNFLAYRRWAANPNRYKEFGQQLHLALAERGLVTIPPELYLSSEKERMAQATSAIRKVAEENPVAFQAALRQLGVANTNPTTPARAWAPNQIDDRPQPAPMNPATQGGLA